MARTLTVICNYTAYIGKYQVVIAGDERGLVQQRMKLTIGYNHPRLWLEEDKLFFPHRCPMIYLPEGYHNLIATVNADGSFSVRNETFEDTVDPDWLRFHRFIDDVPMRIGAIINGKPGMDRFNMNCNRDKTLGVIAVGGNIYITWYPSNDLSDLPPNAEFAEEFGLAFEEITLESLGLTITPKIQKLIDEYNWDDFTDWIERCILDYCRYHGKLERAGEPWVYRIHVEPKIAPLHY